MSEDFRRTQSQSPRPAPAAEAETVASHEAVPSLPARLLQAFVSPGKMTRTVAEHPRWIGAMLVGAALLSLSIALIPVEVLTEAQRRAVMARGGTMQEIPESALRIVRTVSIIGPAVAFVVFAFIGAAVTTFIFAFVLGDEGKYRSTSRSECTRRSSRHCSRCSWPP